MMDSVGPILRCAVFGAAIIQKCYEAVNDKPTQNVVL